MGWVNWWLMLPGVLVLWPIAAAALAAWLMRGLARHGYITKHWWRDERTKAMRCYMLSLAFVPLAVALMTLAGGIILIIVYLAWAFVAGFGWWANLIVSAFIAFVWF